MSKPAPSQHSDPNRDLHPCLTRHGVGQLTVHSGMTPPFVIDPAEWDEIADISLGYRTTPMGWLDNTRDVIIQVTGWVRRIRPEAGSADLQGTEVLLMAAASVFSDHPQEISETWTDAKRYCIGDITDVRRREVMHLIQTATDPLQYIPIEWGPFWERVVRRFFTEMEVFE